MQLNPYVVVVAIALLITSIVLFVIHETAPAGAALTAAIALVIPSTQKIE